MAAQNNIPNFNFQSDPSIAAIASLYQKKAMNEQEMRLQQSQVQSQQQDRVMNVMKMASDMTQDVIQSSARNQMLEGRKNLQDLLGQANDMVPSGQGNQ